MKVTVVGGTHIGIKGLYGERVFNVDCVADVETIIREENNLQDAILSSYIKNNILFHTLENEGGLTLFEWRIL